MLHGSIHDSGRPRSFPEAVGQVRIYDERSDDGMQWAVGVAGGDLYGRLAAGSVHL